MRIGIDIGGTFTDFVIYDEEKGETSTYKAPSTPDDPSQAVLDGVNDIADAVSNLRVIHGSTVATNSLIERKGARTAIITTRGFSDVLAIGRQNRPDIFDLRGRRPEPLIPRELRFEIPERVNFKGEVLTPLSTDKIPALLDAVEKAEVESVAICLLFSFLHPEHEKIIADAARDRGLFVSASSDIHPEFREYERTVATAINAYVSPVMSRYLKRLDRELDTADFRVMQSNGGVISAERAGSEGIRAILSGPAGGVVGAYHVAVESGYEKAITFDMGGTSTDVSLCDGRVGLTSEGEVAGLPIRIPMIDIHTVGSGGGSIARIDSGGALKVGPESAGAYPGPICYGKGGREPAVTDANLILGRLLPGRFLDGRMPLDYDAALKALDTFATQAGIFPKDGLSSAQVAALGVVAVANSHMEKALRVISVERGHDPKDFAMVSFGGAGGLHACELARLLDIKTVIVPRYASTLSAFGMLAADSIKNYSRTVMLPGSTLYDEIEKMIAPLCSRGRENILAEGVNNDDIGIVPQLDMRYVGQSYELTIEFTPDFIIRFHETHRKAYGYSDPGRDVEIVNLRVLAIGEIKPPPLPRGTSENASAAPEKFYSEMVTREGLSSISCYDGEDLMPGHEIDGPALVVQKDTTVFMEHEDRATVDNNLNLIIEVASDRK